MRGTCWHCHGWVMVIITTSWWPEKKRSGGQRAPARRPGGPPDPHPGAWLSLWAGSSRRRQRSLPKAQFGPPPCPCEASSQLPTSSGTAGGSSICKSCEISHSGGTDSIPGAPPSQLPPPQGVPMLLLAPSRLHDVYFENQHLGMLMQAPPPSIEASISCTSPQLLILVSHRCAQGIQCPLPHSCLPDLLFCIWQIPP